MEPVLSTYISFYSYLSPFSNPVDSSPEGCYQADNSIKVDNQVMVNNRPAPEVAKQIDDIAPQLINSLSEKSEAMGTHKRKTPEASSLSSKEYSELRICKQKKIKNSKTAKHWKGREDQLLLHSQSEGKTWKEIAEEFKNRSSGACRERRRRLQEREDVGSARNDPRPWAPEHIIYLQKMAIETNYSWKEIVQLMNKKFPEAPRSLTGCKNKFRTISFFLTKVKEIGQDWRKVATLMKERFPKIRTPAEKWKRLWEEISPSLSMDSSLSLLSLAAPSTDQLQILTTSNDQSSTIKNYSSTSSKAAASEIILPTDLEIDPPKLIKGRGICKNKLRSRWTPEQIICLHKTAIKTNYKWKEVALLMKKKFPDAPRSLAGCKIKFSTISFLLSVVQETGQNWEKVAKLIKERFSREMKSAVGWKELWEKISSSLPAASAPVLRAVTLQRQEKQKRKKTNRPRGVLCQRWKPEHIFQLTKLAKQYEEQNWEEVARRLIKLFPKTIRTASSCQTKWFHINENQMKKSSSFLLPQSNGCRSTVQNYSRTSFKTAESETRLTTDQENVFLQGLNSGEPEGETNSILPDSVINPLDLEFVNSCFNSNI